MTTHEQIIAAAKEAGIKRAFVCAEPEACPDDDGCCYGQKPDGYWVKDETLERFYAIVANQTASVSDRNNLAKALQFAVNMHTDGSEFFACLPDEITLAAGKELNEFFRLVDMTNTEPKP